MRKSLIVIGWFLCCVVCQASVVHIDGPVYQTQGMYAGTAHWYLDMSQLYNKTAQQQLDFVASLNQSNAYGFSSWRMADEGEIFDIIELYAVGGERNTELASILGLNRWYSPSWAYLNYVKYDGSYKQIKLDYYDAGTGYEGWRTWRSSPSSNPNSHLGAFVIATPEPASLGIMALGLLFLRRKSRA